MRLATTLGAIALFVTCGVAQAQLRNESWVSGTGNDQNACTRMSPCLTFNGAYGKIAAGGVIYCVDAGSFGGATIMKSITIICDSGEGRIVGSVDISAAATDVVYLSGLNITKFNNPTTGITITQAASVTIADTVIRGIGAGISFTPSSGGSVALYVRNTVISSNNNGGVLIAPTNGVAVSAVLDGVAANGNTFGVKADGSGSTSGIIDVEVRDSIAAKNNNNGYIATSNAGQAEIRFKITNSSAENNGAYGAVATGAQAFMILDRSSLTGNGTGLAQLNGSTVGSYGNNGVNFNANNIVGTITPVGLH